MADRTPEKQKLWDEYATLYERMMGDWKLLMAKAMYEHVRTAQLGLGPTYEIGVPWGKLSDVYRQGWLDLAGVALDARRISE